jgi:hypothetical protein
MSRDDLRTRPAATVLGIIKSRWDGPSPLGFVDRRRRQDVRDPLYAAKQVLMIDEKVLYGIFGFIGSSGYFPPREFLNEFLMGGSDPCDQDGRMSHWRPFAVSAEEYRDLKEWWAARYADAVEDSLGVENWDDWVQEILDR